MAKKRIGRRPKGEGSLFKRGNVWWYKITKNGETITKSTGKNDVDEARVERDRVVRSLSGIPAIKLPKLVTITELLDDYLDYLRFQNKKSVNIIEQVLNANIRPVFGLRVAASMTSDQLHDYRKKRQQEDGASDATLNNELSYMRSAFYHGMKRQTPKKVLDVPFFPIVKTQNTRSGFVEFDEYEAILNELPSSLKPLFVAGYHSGCRSGELTGLQWSAVNFDRGYIELEAARTKNEEGRYLPFYGDLREWMEKEKAIRDAQFPNCPWVFFWHEGCSERNGVKLQPGSKINAFRKTWKAAVKRAGHDGLLFHDLRRSAVRNMVQECGIPEAQAMKISGHKTYDMLRRYNIVSLKNVMDTATKMDAWMEAKRAGVKPKVAKVSNPRRKAKVASA
jgi:integrase